MKVKIKGRVFLWKIIFMECVCIFENVKILNDKSVYNKIKDIINFKWDIVR